MSQVAKRIDFVDISKGLLMILVIIGHVNGYGNNLKSFIYSFHMPAFFLLYGIINTKKKNYFFTISRRTISLMLPYFLWSFLYAGINRDTIIPILYGSHLSLGNVSNSSLWFIPTFYISVVIFETLKQFNILSENRKIRNNLIIIFFIILSITLPNCFKNGYPFGFNISMMGVAFICIGMNLKNIVFRIKEVSIKKCLLISMLSFFAIFIYKINTVEYILMAENIYGNVFLFLIPAISGSVFIILVSIFIEKLQKGIIFEILTQTGKNTISFFALQKIVLYFISKIVSYAHLTNILSIICISICTFFAIYILNKKITKYVPALNGKFDF